MIVILASLFFNLAMKKVSAEWAKWLVFIAIAIAGCVVGYFLVKFRKVGIALLAAWGGVMLGFVITGAFVVKNDVAYYCILVACAVVMFLIAFKIEVAVVIILTAFMGSYGVIRGISLYAGHFPSETELHRELSTGAVTWHTFSKWFYLYLGGIAVLTILSSWFQFRTNGRQDESQREIKRFIK